MNIASCACAVLLPKPVAAHFFLFPKGVAFKNKIEDDFCCLQKQLHLNAFPDEGRVFCVCFILLPLWSISFITCLHDSQTTYTPSSGHKHVKQYRRTTLPSKENKQNMWFELEASPSLSTKNTVGRGRGFKVETRFLGSLHVRVDGVSGLTYDMCGHPKMDIFENGSFWKRIRVHIAWYICDFFAIFFCFWQSLTSLSPSASLPLSRPFPFDLVLESALLSLMAGQDVQTGTASFAERQPTGSGHHVVEDVPKLRPRQGLPAAGLLLGDEAERQRLHRVPLHRASQT